MKLKKHKPEPDFYEEIRTYLPPDMDPLTVISEEGCDNEYFTLSEDARRIICKYGCCPHGLACREAM